jgi:hypothetical protein
MVLVLVDRTKGRNVNRSWMRPASEFSPDDLPGRPFPGVAITRIVRLSPEWAELALDEAFGHASADPFPVLVGGSLELQSRTVTDDCSRRRLTGRLVSNRRWFQVPVELQLAGWSASTTEVALRPLRSGRRPGWGRWYLRVGTVVMDLLVTSVNDPGCLRELLKDAADATSIVLGVQPLPRRSPVKRTKSHLHTAR